jgi:WS/DGAT/MGAT family acyltransferase
VWIDDVGFDIDRHVFASEAGPGSADEATFEAVGRLMSTQLDRSKPLWEAHLVTGLPQDRWLLVVRMHHGMVDGVTSAAIVSKLLTLTPDVEELVEEEWVPAAEPSDAQLLQHAVVDNVKAAAELSVKTAQAMLKPLLKPGVLPTLPKPSDLEPLRPVAEPVLDPTLTGPVGPHRSFRHARIALDDVKRVRAGLGGTVNDVILAMSARAFRTLLLRRGEACTGRSIRAMMPVAMKGSGGGEAPGNQISAVPVELPVGDMTPSECFARIHEQTASLKVLSEAMPAPAQAQAPGFGLPVMLTLGSRMASTMPKLVDTVVSNVPGPQQPLYLQGRRLEGVSACIALWTPMRIAVQVLSYNGTLSFAVVADRDSIPEIGWFVEGAEQALQELLQAAEEAPA